MTGKGTFALMVMATCLACLSSGSARADVRRERPERRPYIVEIGIPQSIGVARLDQEARRTSDLAEYLSDYGYPDYAEIQEIRPEWPWESYEVRAYYLDRDLELAFGHVLFSPAMGGYGVMKYQGTILPDKRREIDVVLASRVAPPATAATVLEPAPQPVAEEQPEGLLSEALVARIEAAAERAAQAADVAAEQSAAAARAADRTVSVLEQMERNAGE